LINVLMLPEAVACHVPKPRDLSNAWVLLQMSDLVNDRRIPGMTPSASIKAAKYRARKDLVNVRQLSVCFALFLVFCYQCDNFMHADHEQATAHAAAHMPMGPTAWRGFVLARHSSCT